MSGWGKCEGGRGPRRPYASVSAQALIALSVDSMGLLAGGLVSLLSPSSLLAYIAHGRGLNPDNVVIPLIASASDTTATLRLLPALALTRLIA